MVQNFKIAIVFLEQLESVPRLQHGLALMLWDTFLHQIFKNVVTSLANDDPFPIPGGRVHIKKREDKRRTFGSIKPATKRAAYEDSNIKCDVIIDGPDLVCHNFILI